MGGSPRPRPNRLAEKLFQIRLGLGLTQAELFERLHYSHSSLFISHISAFELGKREPPLPLLLRYARVAGIALEVLADDELDLPSHLLEKATAAQTTRAAIGRPFCGATDKQEESSRPLSDIETAFAVDSSGLSTNRYARWIETKYGKGKVINNKDWIKVHIMCGVKTNIVTAVELSGPNTGDSPRFKPLVLATSNNFVMNEVSADKAYSAEDNLKLVQSKQAMPYIDFRSNASAGNRRSGSTWKRMYNFYQYNQEWFYQHYHKRSNVESTFSMIKAKFGGSLRSKTRMAQYNEALCKILCHNICMVIQSMYELGVEPAFWTEDV